MAGRAGVNPGVHPVVCVECRLMLVSWKNGHEPVHGIIPGRRAYVSAQAATARVSENKTQGSRKKVKGGK